MEIYMQIIWNDLKKTIEEPANFSAQRSSSYGTSQGFYGLI